MRAAMLCLLALASGLAHAGRVHVAVASNFAQPAREIAAAFTEDTSHQVVLSLGATGKLYAQIRHSAPFQVYLAADSERPTRAEQDGLAVAGSRFTYAVGRLALFSADPARLEGGGDALAELSGPDKLAIANPATAPYGVAAVQTLQALAVHDQLRDRMVMGESIGQTFQFVATGNAALGLVALSQVVDQDGYWQVPGHLHQPIRQDAVLLRRGADSEAAGAFLNYLRGERARAIIRRHGYGTE